MGQPLSFDGTLNERGDKIKIPPSSERGQTAK